MFCNYTANNVCEIPIHVYSYNFKYSFNVFSNIFIWWGSKYQGFPGRSGAKESTCGAGDPGSERSPGEKASPAFIGFPVDSDSKESTCNMGDLGSISGLGRSPGGEHGNPLTPVFLPGESPWTEEPDGIQSMGL